MSDFGRKNVYTKREWQELTATVKAEHPLCQCCLALSNGKKLTMSKEVHHIVPIEQDPQGLGWFNKNNLVALCTDCHHKTHQGMITISRQLNGRLLIEKTPLYDAPPEKPKRIPPVDTKNIRLKIKK